MNPAVTLRTGDSDDRPLVEAFYREVGYSPVVAHTDRLLLAASDGHLLGVARLCTEHGVCVLRGMRVHPSHQRQGIGSALLRLVATVLGRESCFCLPFSHLVEFYRRAGFGLVADTELPSFLAERASRYRKKGESISPMVRYGQDISDSQIETERLLMRRFVLDDVQAFYELGTDPQIIRYVGNSPYHSIEVARETLAAGPLMDYAIHGFGRFACVWKETGRVIGFCGLKFLPDLQEAEIGYRFVPRFWGLGLATESSRAAIAYARYDLKLRRVIALIHPDNAASIRVVQKLAFAFERKVTVSWFPGVGLDLYAMQLDDGGS